MKPWIAGCLAGALAGVVASLAALKAVNTPGSWFSVSSDVHARPRPTVQLTRQASEGLTCLYASVAYKPGDVLDVQGTARLVCTAGRPDAAGVTHGLWLAVKDGAAP